MLTSGAGREPDPNPANRTGDANRRPANPGRETGCRVLADGAGPANRTGNESTGPAAKRGVPCWRQGPYCAVCRPRAGLAGVGRLPPTRGYAAGFDGRLPVKSWAGRARRLPGQSDAV